VFAVATPAHNGPSRHAARQKGFADGSGARGTRGTCGLGAWEPVVAGGVVSNWGGGDRSVDGREAGERIDAPPCYSCGVNCRTARREADRPSSALNYEHYHHHRAIQLLYWEIHRTRQTLSRSVRAYLYRVRPLCSS